MKKSKTLLGISTVLISLILTTNAFAAKTDVVVLINGNAVTGEIKKLDFGSLRYSTDSMGTVNIDWEDIVNVTSNQDLQIELINGNRYFGKLLVPDDKFFIRIQTPSQEYYFPAEDIVRITPIDSADRFWQRIDGSFKVGSRVEKSSQVTTADVDTDLSYRTRKYLVGLKINSSWTRVPEIGDDGESNAVTTSRKNVAINYQRFRPNRWFTDWFTSWESNDEQLVDQRRSVGGAIGRYLVQTNKNQFSLTAGVQATNTEYLDDPTAPDAQVIEATSTETTTEAEGRIEIRYLRRNLVPETSITFTSKIYPLLNDLSNYRAETGLSLEREFFEDFFLDLTVNHSYLSDPQSGAESSDYTFTTSFGYSF